MCKEPIAPELEAYTYGGHVYCTTGCAGDQLHEDLRNSHMVLRNQSEYESLVGSEIRELSEAEVIALGGSLVCGDKMPRKEG